MGDRAPVIAIDGPSGSGKGTIAQSLAQRLGWHRLDSGALYRAVGLAATRHGVDLANATAVADLTKTLDLAFVARDDSEVVLLDGEDVTQQIRSETAGQAASRVAALPAVRKALLERQHAFAVRPGLVADGRDMGTVVFPTAELKVFLTASPEERARRRHKQLNEKGISVSLRGLSKDIAERDERDASRAEAPLRPADDAKLLDSTDLSPLDVVQLILDWVYAAGLATMPTKQV